MKFITFLLLFFLISCGADISLEDGLVIKRSPKDPRTTHTTDSSFIKYIDFFIDDHIKTTGKNISVSHIPINFGNVKKEKAGVIGICYIYKGNGKTWREIRIDRTWWENTNEYGKEVLIKHELGHCALDRDHRNDSYMGVNISIMHSHILNSHLYESNKYGYDVELYTQETDLLKLSINSN